MQLPSSGHIVIKVSMNKGHSQLVMNEGSRIWNQKETKRKIKSELLTTQLCLRGI